MAYGLCSSATLHAAESESLLLQLNVVLSLVGMNVGTIVTMPLTGLLTKYGFDGGWASVFYCFGMFIQS